MKNLIYVLVLFTLFFTSCGKDEFEGDKEEINIVGTKWEGSGIVGGAENTKIRFEFLEGGKMKGFYEPNNWDGTYNFNVETNKGVINESGEIEMDFEIIGNTLKFEIDPGKWFELTKK